MPIFKKKDSSLKTPSEQEDLDVLNCVRRTKDCGMPSDIDELEDNDKPCVEICKKKYYGLRRHGEELHRLGQKMNNATRRPLWPPPDREEGNFNMLSRPWPQRHRT